MDDVRAETLHRLAELGLAQYESPGWLTKAGLRLLPVLMNGDEIEPLVQRRAVARPPAPLLSVPTRRSAGRKADQGLSADEYLAMAQQIDRLRPQRGD